MSVQFFDNYKEYVFVALEDKPDDDKFHPENYDKHFIITVSLNNPLISCWREANKYQVTIDKSVEKAVQEFNQKQKGFHHLQVLELEEDKAYFVWAMSCKINKENIEDLHERISYLLEKISNSLYVGESWYRLIGERGRISRQLFSFTWKEYMK